MTWMPVIPALVLGGIAVGLPPERLAKLLAGPGSTMVPSVTSGLWLFKVMLLAHAAAWYYLVRRRPARPRRPLLAGGPPPEAAAGSGERAVLIGLLGVAAALRLFDLGNELWFDEIRTLVGYVRRPVGYILSTFESQNQHLLYSLLARGTVTLLGESIWALRLPAAVLGVLSLWAVWWFATLVTTRREALLATALLTFSYHHVWFSQNARGYTGLLMLTLVGSGWFLRLVRGEFDGWGPAVVYAVTMALAAYLQLAAVFVGLAHGLVWVGLLRRHRGDPAAVWVPAAALALSATLTLQLYAPVLPQLLGTIATPTMAGLETDWKSPLWLAREMVRGLAQGVPGGLAAVGLAGVVLMTGIVSYWRPSPTVAATMVLPAVLTAGGYLVTAHNLWPRMFFFAAGFLALIAIRGGFVLARVIGPARGSPLAIAGTVAVIALSATTVPRAWRPKQDFPGARDFVERIRTAGDAVVTVDLSRYPYQAYLATDWTPVDDVGSLEKIERQSRRTWVLYTFPTRLAAVQPEIWARLNRDYMKVAEFSGTVGGGAVVVLVRA